MWRPASSWQAAKGRSGGRVQGDARRLCRSAPAPPLALARPRPAGRARRSPPRPPSRGRRATTCAGWPLRPMSTVLGKTRGVQSKVASPSASSRIGSLNGRRSRKRADHLGRFLVVDRSDVTPLLARRAAIASSDGISVRHGSHQVAQKLSTTTLPASGSSRQRLPFEIDQVERRHGPAGRPRTHDVRSGRGRSAAGAQARPSHRRAARSGGRVRRCG